MDETAIDYSHPTELFMYFFIFPVFYNTFKTMQWLSTASSKYQVDTYFAMATEHATQYIIYYKNTFNPNDSIMHVISNCSQIFKTNRIFMGLVQTYWKCS